MCCLFIGGKFNFIIFCAKLMMLHASTYIGFKICCFLLNCSAVLFCLSFSGVCLMGGRKSYWLIGGSLERGFWIF